MVRLTRLNGEVFYLNENMVERVDAHHDTAIFTTSGNVYTVVETAEEVAEAIRQEKALVTCMSIDRARSLSLRLIEGEKR